MHHFSDVGIFPSFKFLEVVRSKAFLMSEDIAKFPSFELYHFNLHQQCMSVCFPIQCVIKRFDLGQTERWNCETLIIFLLLWIMGHLFLGVGNYTPCPSFFCVVDLLYIDVWLPHASLLSWKSARWICWSWLGSHMSTALPGTIWLTCLCSRLTQACSYDRVKVPREKVS